MFWILVALALPLLFYFFIIKPFSFWSRKGVPHNSFIREWLDILRLVLQREALPEMTRLFYNEYPGKRYSGGYQFFTPILFLRDPELIKQITVKDFDHFSDHNQIIPEDVEPLLGKNLFSLKGDRWRDMRATLSPSFTSSKMKAMFNLINDCAVQFTGYFNKDNTANPIDMKDAFTRFANDVIASTAFGVTCNSLIDQNNEFYLMGKEATNFKGFWNNIKMIAVLIAPRLCRFLEIRIFSSSINNFFRRLVTTNIESREKNGIVRHDMIHLLIEARNGRLKHEEQTGTIDTGFAVIEESSVGKREKIQKPKLTDDDLTAQALIFFFAGFESVSTLMCFLVYELAVNPDIQERLRQQVDETLEAYGGSLTYEGLLQMKYLDMVVSEILRKWPVQPGIDRLCTKPYTILPVNEGEVPLRIEEGDLLWLPIFGIHRDPQYYPNPDRFDPERFSNENKDNIFPLAYIPFGAGPRSCIGNRFALLETKTIIFQILANFEICVSEKTTVPLMIAKDNFNMSAMGGFWFRLKRRN